jgi:hypothetical protein
MKTRDLPLLLSALALATACTPDFDPASEVRSLRVLAIRAEPPEIAPAGDGAAPSRATLASLVAHPAFADDLSRRAVVLHVACTPTPGDPGPSPCTVLSELADPTALLGAADLAAACATPGRGAPGEITFAGIEVCGVEGCAPVSVPRDPADPGSTVALPAPAYELPADYTLAALPQGAAERVLGLAVTSLALALDAAPAELAPAEAVPDACAALSAVIARFEAEWPLRAHVAALKRIGVRGPEAGSTPNQNPVISGVAMAGAALPAPGPTPAAVAPGVEVELLPVLPGDFAALRETYVHYDAAGTPIETKQEDWTFSWFSTAGDLDELHTNDPAEPQVLTAPRTGRAVVWTVVRDLRGGTAWTAGEIEAR